MYIILFYRYHPLSSDETLMEVYRLALQALCQSLGLTGRILVGCSDNTEGINGTLAGSPKSNVEAFTHALLGPEYCQNHQVVLHPAVQQFWDDCRDFTERAQVPLLTMTSPSDFKWSQTTTDQPLFPDLNVKLVPELIGTGGKFSDFSVQDTSIGYLTPKEWHQALQQRSKESSVLIDCRNTKECQIGHFEGALDPRTTTFAQFPQWVKEHASDLADKTVYMYCTGGIRCEKASAYIRKHVPQVQQVRHLQGGIHKYMEEYGQEGLWKGKNFVFDGRTAASASDKDNEVVVGQCVYCQLPYDEFRPENVCTVCREPTLVCPSCRSDLVEIHCIDHFYLRKCYFTKLSLFEKKELEAQLTELEQNLSQIAVGRKFKQKRKTLLKQCDKIRAHLSGGVSVAETSETSLSICRSCGASECDGVCWGFYSLKRKELLQERKRKEPDCKKQRTTRRPTGSQRQSQLEHRQRLLQEIQQLHLATKPSEHRFNGIRVPPPCTRVIQTNTKGKWCGKSVLQVVRQEFADVSKELEVILGHNLLRVNGKIVTKEDDVKLKNMDIIDRIVHWHEPPVLVPERIPVEIASIPGAVIEEYNLNETEATLLICDKPSSVPVHPTGPYFSNSLTVMVEAQCGLEPKSLFPCHRLDRVTSGLTICTSHVEVSRMVQSKMDKGSVRKLYIAKVQGKFPSKQASFGEVQLERNTLINFRYLEDVDAIEIDAPIHAADPTAGIRVIANGGKPSTSRFRRVSYNADEDTSLIVCHPVTGRGHQLRVHLQALGYPITGDILYGGKLLSGTGVKDAAVDVMMQNFSEGENGSDLVSVSDVDAAKSACRCCTGGKEGIEASFTQAQLLGGGHAISLHALRYEIDFYSKKDATKLIGTLSMQVGIPAWADLVQEELLHWLV